MFVVVIGGWKCDKLARVFHIPMPPLFSHIKKYLRLKGLQAKATIATYYLPIPPHNASQP